MNSGSHWNVTNEPLAIVRPALYPSKYCPCVIAGNSQGAKKNTQLILIFFQVFKLYSSIIKSPGVHSETAVSQSPFRHSILEEPFKLNPGKHVIVTTSPSINSELSDTFKYVGSTLL